MEAPAFWTIYPAADRDQVRHFIDAVARQLGIPVPPLHGDVFALPPHPDRVIAAMDIVDPDWRDKALIYPPR